MRLYELLSLSLYIYIYIYRCLNKTYSTLYYTMLYYYDSSHAPQTEQTREHTTSILNNIDIETTLNHKDNTQNINTKIK